jgi:hypothetical protein
MRLFQGVPIVWLYERPPRGPKRSTDSNAR